MQEQPFSNREILKMFREQSDDLKAHMTSLIEPLTAQVTYTNGKVKRMVLILTVVASVTATLFAMNGSEVFELILKII